MFFGQPNSSVIKNHFLPSLSNTWDIGSTTNFLRNLYFSGDLIYSGADNYLRANTSPGADNARLFVTSSGGANSARGPYIEMAGINHGVAPGVFNVVGANVAAGHIQFSITNSSALIKYFNATGNLMAQINNSGDLQLDGTNGGDLIIARVGKGLKLKEGSNGRMGTVALVGGTATVSNTSVTANTRVIPVRSTTGGTVGHLSYTINAGVSFTINSSSGTDTSTIVWVLVEPA